MLIMNWHSEVSFPSLTPEENTLKSFNFIGILSWGALLTFSPHNPLHSWGIMAS